MGPLLSAGGFFVRSGSLHSLEHALAAICTKAGFPNGEEFKWSPARGSWMRDNLTLEARTQFFVEVLTELVKHDAKTIVVVADTRRTPRRYVSTESFVTKLLMERVEIRACKDQSTCLMVFDRPGGARPEENKFLGRIIDTIQAGTEYVQMKSFAMAPVSTDSRHVRCLQAADLITASTTAVIAGQSTHTQEVWALIKSMFISNWYGDIGGTGCKIYGDRCEYHNLYHWLLGDTGWAGRVALPWHAWPYYKGTNIFSPR